MVIKIKEESGIKGKLTITFNDAITGKLKRISKYNNLIVTVGKTMITKRLAGSANNATIDYGAVGTSAVAPAVGDTALGTELERKVVTSLSNTATEVLTTVFFGASEANGTLTEFGLFAETGATMFNHAVISETKTSSETMTVDVTITFT